MLMKKHMTNQELKTLKQIDEIAEVSESSSSNSKASGETLDKDQHVMHLVTSAVVVDKPQKELDDRELLYQGFAQEFTHN
jgi:hypothetical protein